MNVTILQVDAFTGEPFKGNPAAVCILEGSADEVWMQNVAAEMNLAETAFVNRAKTGFDLRWFTPTCEVNLCGHATLATAHALWETGLLHADADARFNTISGILTAKRKDDWIELDFPAIPSQATDFPPEFEAAMGGAPSVIRKNEFGYLAEFDSEQIVRNLRPDFRRLKEIPAVMFIATSESESSEYDFVSRMFAPGIGIDEDPVTGAAHCCLGPYWRERLGKDQFVAFQASARGGVVRLLINEDRALLQGQAVTVLRGELV